MIYWFAKRCSKVAKAFVKDMRAFFKAKTQLEGDEIAARESLEETKKHGVRVKKPKTKAGRRHVSLPDIVVEALREHRRAQLERRLKFGLGKLSGDDFVFAEPDGSPRGPRAFSSEWADVATAIGMPDVVFHALRHTHASQLIDAGVDIVTISKRLGHANPNITLKVYAHLFRNKTRRRPKRSTPPWQILAKHSTGPKC